MGYTNITVSKTGNTKDSEMTNKTPASNKTQQLIKLIEGGTHRIDQYGYLMKWVSSRGMWMNINGGWRKDVIHGADMHFYRIAA